jgi:peptidoglycan-associated lipoprotein
MTLASSVTRQRVMRLAGALSVVCWLGACSTSTRLDPLPPVENRSPGGAAGAASAAQALPTAQSRVATVDLGRQGGVNGGGGSVNGLAPLGGVNGGGAAGSALAGADGKVIYFDFDSYAVRDDYQPLIAGTARRLGGERARKLLLEGHTDERGGREYNLALGQRRAEAVSRALALLGVQDGQLEAVSYGKERPAANGNDESAWARNRRVELRDR